MVQRSKQEITSIFLLHNQCWKGLFYIENLLSVLEFMEQFYVRGHLFFSESITEIGYIPVYDTNTAERIRFCTVFKLILCIKYTFCTMKVL